ncbi:Lipase member H [Pseudolycoriella hygida]|uniref:Lipase member H n=1 Tax=Pseudolycoriella hygida TaxID=35572 RepID=A0A9Q0N7P3_9DIPT|nr:Lipase member H [Pseudolycoriella hygida]
MKLACFFIASIAAIATAIPIYENDVLNLNETISSPSNEEDWQLVPDSDGKLHLVDINNVNLEIEPLFNAFNDIVFHLWTRANVNSPQIVTIYNNAQLDASHFSPQRQIRFHIHGWGAGGPTWGGPIRSALLTHVDCNYFLVDWGAGSNTVNYITARNRVNMSGAVVAQFIDWLNTRGLPFSAITIVGSSLGAHLGGAAGKRTTRGRVAAIAGLDPAGPLFSLDVPADRLHSTDADYVESHVTDAGRLGKLFIAKIIFFHSSFEIILGFEHPIGHSNFYPNWGTSQPGCGADLVGQCGHFLVSDFFAASINSANIFGSIRCRNLEDIRQRNCVVSGPSKRMGGDPLQDGPGIVGSVYFLTTDGVYPFAHGPR